MAGKFTWGGSKTSRPEAPDSAVGYPDMPRPRQVLECIEQRRQRQIGRHAAERPSLGLGDGGEHRVLDGEAVQIAFQRQVSFGHVIVRTLQQSDGLTLFQVQGHEAADRFQFGGETARRSAGRMVQPQPSVKRPAGAKRDRGVPLIGSGTAAGDQAETADGPVIDGGIGGSAAESSASSLKGSTLKPMTASISNTAPEMPGMSLSSEEISRRPGSGEGNSSSLLTAARIRPSSRDDAASRDTVKGAIRADVPPDRANRTTAS